MDKINFEKAQLIRERLKTLQLAIEERKKILETIDKEHNFNKIEFDLESNDHLSDDGVNNSMHLLNLYQDNVRMGYGMLEDYHPHKVKCQITFSKKELWDFIGWFFINNISNYEQEINRLETEFKKLKC